jgi:hypothetical protein
VILYVPLLSGNSSPCLFLNMKERVEVINLVTESLCFQNYFNLGVFEMF